MEPINRGDSRQDDGHGPRQQALRAISPSPGPREKENQGAQRSQGAVECCASNPGQELEGQLGVEKEEKAREVSPGKKTGQGCQGDEAPPLVDPGRGLKILILFHAGVGGRHGCCSSWTDSQNLCYSLDGPGVSRRKGAAGSRIVSIAAKRGVPGPRRASSAPPER